MARANATALTSPAPQPLRIFTVTGTPQVAATRFTMAAASAGVRISALPSPLATTLVTGHPMLMSMSATSAPCRSTIPRA